MGGYGFQQSFEETGVSESVSANCKIECWSTESMSCLLTQRHLAEGSGRAYPSSVVKEKKLGLDAEESKHAIRIFNYVNFARRHIICTGIKSTWEELKAQSREQRTSGGVDTQLPDVQNVRYYKTQGPGPELFAVAGNAVF